MTIRLEPDSHLLVLTGAGISAESGVPTFRDAGGLWEGYRFEEVASPTAFVRDPLLVWRFYSMRRAGMRGIVPNAAHHALVEVERRLGDRFLLVTQNVDGLHRAAGSERLVEMHGNLMRSRCSRCDRPAFEDTTAYAPGVAPMCGRCKQAGYDGLLRPDIVWFGEAIPHDAMERTEAFMQRAGAHLRFLAVGTSGMVYPAAGFVNVARTLGGRSFLVNKEAPDNIAAFDEVALGAAAHLLPTFFVHA
ncbi:MAG: NAD-dependent deacylase [Deltaproteobacteria bacterium]|nr:NAD-dependent deacylase [Deltaproteobacteria bacterium]